MGNTLHSARTDRTRSPGAFTLIEVLVSIAIIGLLVGVMLPSIALVRSTSQKVVCSSNLRQTGLGLHMYANDNDDSLPLSSFSIDNSGKEWNTTPLQLRIDVSLRPHDVIEDVPDETEYFWDGLGFLFEQGYLTDGRIFYCPSHLGEKTFEHYNDQFAGAEGDILSNYQYRGEEGPNGEFKLDQFQSDVALVSDGFIDMVEINHPNGMNVLRAGMSVGWFRDTNLETFANTIRFDDDDAGDSFQEWEDRWRILDEPVINGWRFWP